MKLNRKEMEEWFPIYLRFLGSVITCILICANIFGVGGISLAPAYIAAAGMIGYKSIHDFGRIKVNNNNGSPNHGTES